ncbi:MAG: DUF3244 domain-containing protein [Bacteroides sp.]|jgi:hypothetical protein|nr:DUF3244 domain-containing protein [Bacteroides sp.]MCI1682378.1 DUF3244 domain-containing protein [Bacteroides sp.]
MKRLLSICVFILLGLSVGAEEVNIQLSRHKDDDVDTRSLIIEPTATHDEDVVHIYYDDYLLENLQITVKDSSGNVIYSNIASVSCNYSYSFILNNIESGEYMLELSYGNNFLYGYFSI